MGKLVITYEGQNLGEMELNKERVTIGRHPDNDIVLQNDRAISGHHAVIITIMSDSFLEDLDSTNGTVVNGKQIGKHPLSNGDLVQIGRHNLKYEGKVTDYDEDFEKTMILKPSEILAATGSSAGSAPPAPSAPPINEPATIAGASDASGPAPTAVVHQSPAPPSAPARPPLGKVQVLSGANAGKELQLTKALTTLGKPGVQVAAITRRVDGYYIVHVGPPNAPVRPKVNDQMISTQAQKLAEADKIEIAGTQMKFSLIEQ